MDVVPRSESVPLVASTAMVGSLASGYGTGSARVSRGRDMEERQARNSHASRQRDARGSGSRVRRRSEAVASRNAARPYEARADRGRGAGRSSSPQALSAPAAFVMDHRLPLLVVAIVAALVFMLYGPTRDYYRAWRRSLELQATYDAIVADNQSVQDDVSRLQSRQGIEEEARKRGYVDEGETAVVVEGLPDEDAGSTDATLDLPWYLQVGDLVFGYQPEAQQ